MIISYELILRNDSLTDGIESFRNIDMNIFKESYILKKRNFLGNCIDTIEKKDLEYILEKNFIAVIEFNNIETEVLINIFLKKYKLIDKKFFPNFYQDDIFAYYCISANVFNFLENCKKFAIIHHDFQNIFIIDKTLDKGS